MNLSIYYFKAFLALLLIGFFAPSLMAQNGPTAQLQIIHNAPDPAVDTVDIYVNGEAFLSGVAFRQATAFTEVPAATDLDIQIAPAGAGIANAVGPGSCCSLSPPVRRSARSSPRYPTATSRSRAA